MNEVRVSTDQPIAWWLRLVVLLFAALFTAGAVIALLRPAMLVSPNDEITGAAHIFAGYMAARNLALALTLMATLAMGARRLLGGLMVLSGLIQILDACMDCFEGRWAVAPGVLVLGLVCLLVAARLCGSPFWRAKSWTS
jgi:hypothetical protein